MSTATPPEFLRWLWRRTIWHPDAIPLDAAYIYVSPLKRIVLPAYDLVIFWLGLAGLVQGLRSVSSVLPHPGPGVFYFVLVLAGLACLIGCAFPGLWRLEIGGKILIVALLTGIGITMIYAGLTFPDHTGVTITPLIAGLLLPPLYRLWTLGRELSDREAATLA